MPNLWVTPDEMGDEGSSPFAYEAAKTASFILWALSGRKYAGVQTITEHYEFPCHSSDRYPAQLWNQPGLFPVEPYLDNGAIVNELAGCGRNSHGRLRLRRYPVRRVLRVVSGETIVDPGSYQVVDHAVLQAAPGRSFDPSGVDVTYVYGTDAPTAGRRAARYLAQEFAKGWAGEDCDLPERVTSISRQGVNYTLLDDQAFLDDMRTGIYSVDLFLKAVNPDNARKPARVFSPDIPRATQVTSDSNTLTEGVERLDLVVSQGEFLDEDLRYRNPNDGSYVDLSMYSWRSEVRSSRSSSSNLLVDLTSYLSLDADDPTVLKLLVPGNITSTMPLSGGFWDIFIWPTNAPGFATKWLSGSVFVASSATEMGVL